MALRGDSGVEHRLELAGEREDASRSRTFLRGLLPELGWDEWIDDACLLVSELVANVALHAHTAATLVISDYGDVLRVALNDANPALPHLLRFSPRSTTGRGLRLVQDLSNTWGAEPSGRGKVVWFSFDKSAKHRSARPGETALQGPGEVDLESFARLGGWEEETPGGSEQADSAWAA